MKRSRFNEEMGYSAALSHCWWHAVLCKRHPSSEEAHVLRRIGHFVVERLEARAQPYDRSASDRALSPG